MEFGFFSHPIHKQEVYLCNKNGIVMKIYALTISLLLVLVTLGGCNSKPLNAKATGLAYEIVVTMNKDLWNSEAGQAIKADLDTDVPGLPQSEPAFKITYVTPEHFNGILTYVRNILIVKLDASMYTQVNISYENDRWTNGQVVMTMNAPTSESIVEYMNAHPTQISDFFSRIEMVRGTEVAAGSYSNIVMDNLKSRFDVMLNAPSEMSFTRNGEDFFWASNNANTGRMDVIVYTFPYTDSNTFTKEYLVAKRDSVLKLNLPGSFPDSYMATETRLDLTYTPITLRGKYCGVMRGLWKMVGDMMGGPFVSITRLDEVNNRVVVAEGFVYAPETSKRNYIRRLEAALYTLRLPGEFDQPAAESMKKIEQDSSN